MPILDNIGNIFKTLRVYLLGRGLVSLAVIAASFIGGPLPALAVAIGGTLLSGFMRLQKQGMYEDQMVDLYRDDIAARLNIAPGDVTRAHLREAAKDNEVIDQALKRQKHKSAISFVTSALAGAVTFGLVGFHMPDAIGGFFAEHVQGLLGSVLKFASVGIVAGTSSLIVHDGLQAFIGVKTGVSKAAAHDRILEMEAGMRRGWGISKEQVYGVLVAGNPSLQNAIHKKFGKEYARMRPAEQTGVLNDIGVAAEMQTIAAEINAGRAKPGNLAFMIGDATTPYRTRRDTLHPDLVEQTLSNTREFVQERLAPARSFVERLGLTPREAQNYQARLESERANDNTPQRSA